MRTYCVVEVSVRRVEPADRSTGADRIISELAVVTRASSVESAIGKAQAVLGVELDS